MNERCSHLRARAACSVQLLPIRYEGGFCESLNTFISLKPLGIGHANIPHIKAMDVSFHLIYSSLICAKGLQSDKQNEMGHLQTPGGHQNKIIKYLSVGLKF